MNKSKIQINTKNQKYQIIIGNNIIGKLSKIFSRNKINYNQYLIIIDDKIPNHLRKKSLKSLNKKKITILNFKANEKNKSLKSVNKIVDILLKKNFNRNDCLMAIGGGITGDVAGFAASIFKRGLNFINIPSTLLAQVDSSIGGKTGVNTKYGKNLIGSFYQPNLVVSDISFLKTLPKREIICGYGEILKHSLIYDYNFFKFLDKNVTNILNLKSTFIEKAIYGSCIIKKKIVEKDEKEKNLRKILNLGHTFGHAFEAALGFSSKLNHGEAVLLGVATASKFSLLNSFLNKKQYDLIKNHLIKANLPNKLKKNFSRKDLNKILYFMTKDKKNTNKKINLILLKKIGDVEFNKNFDKLKISNFLKKELIN